MDHPLVYPSENLLFGVCAYVKAIHDFDDGKAKAAVFNAFMGLITNISVFREKVKHLQFLYPPLYLMPLEHGIAAYTCFRNQMNVNFAVPIRMDKEQQLISELVVALNKDMYKMFVINLTPLEVSYGKFIDQTVVRSRRFFPSNATLHLIDRVIFHGGYSLPITMEIKNPRDICNYMPLSRCTIQQEETTLYWARTECGQIVVFQNPFVPLEEGMLPLPIFDESIVHSCLPVELKFFFEHLNPKSKNESIKSIASSRTPTYAKAVLVRICNIYFGIFDHLILTVGLLAENGKIFVNTLHLGMYRIAQCMRLANCKVSNVRFISEQLIETFNLFCTEKDCWINWVKESRFMFDLFETFDIKFIRTMCATCIIIQEGLIKSLKQKTGSWSHKDKELCYMLKSLKLQRFNQDWIEIVNELNNIMAHNDSELSQMIEATADLAVKKIHVNQKLENQNMGMCLPCEDAMVLMNTQKPSHHYTFVERLRTEFPQFKWTLIGSGIFFQSIDVDVVVHVDNCESLDDAYAAVAQATQLQQNGNIDEEHIVVLKGVLFGTLVDAQVITKKGHTKAEEKTKAALALTTKLKFGMDDKMKENVHSLHIWFEHASLKGHQLCNLPGIAITCTAVALSNTCNNLNSMLETLRCLLMTDNAISFDSEDIACVTPTSKTQCRPETPMSIYIDNANVSTRITAAWTRHLIDTIAFSLDRQMSDKSSFDFWRQTHMANVATVRAKNDSIIPKKLFKTLNQFGNHPIVDSLHVEELEKNLLLIRCTILRNKSDHYGFTNEIILFGVNEQKNYLDISRGSKRMFLAVSKGFSPEIHTKGDWIQIGHNRIPNAPTLTVDFLACLDMSVWTLV